MPFLCMENLLEVKGTTGWGKPLPSVKPLEVSRGLITSLEVGEASAKVNGMLSGVPRNGVGLVVAVVCRTMVPNRVSGSEGG